MASTRQVNGVVMWGASAGVTSIPLSTTSSLAGRKGQQNWSAIHDELEVNAIALHTPTAQALLVSFDLLYVGQLVRRAVEEAVPGLEPAYLLAAASHTHSAPAADPTKPGLGEVNPKVLDEVAGTAAGVAASLMAKEPTPVVIHAAQRTLDHAINRRLRRWRLRRNGVSRQIRMAPNVKGPLDETVTLIRVDSAEGPLAVLWHYACHPTAFPPEPLVSADFPGVVRAAIREELGMAELPVVFLQGFSGDIRPRILQQANDPKSTVRRFLEGPLFARTDMETFKSWSQSMADQVTQLLGKPGTPIQPYLAAARYCTPACEFATPADESQTLPDVSFQRLDLGSIRITGCSGELVTDYAAHLHALTESDVILLPTGCIDHVLGYFPTSKMLTEGGYEAGGFCSSFDLKNLRPDLEEKVLDGFRRVVASD